MKTYQKITFPAFILFFLWGCGGQQNIDLSDSLNTGREFIEATLRGDIATADRYMLQDSINEQYLRRWDDFRQRQPVTTREDYRDASIIIDSTKELNDSTDIIFYKNSFKKEPTQLKVVRSENGDWRVDFKHTFHEE